MRRPKRPAIERIRKYSPHIVAALRQERKSYHADHSSRGEPTTVIASYNLHKCVGTDGQFAPERTIQVIAELNADVIALQEAHRRFGERTGLLDLDRLKHISGLSPVPLHGSRGDFGWHGNVVLYRQGAVTACRRIVLPGGEPRGALIVDLALPSGPLRVIATHLGLLRRSRTRQIRTLQLATRSLDARPTLLVGDLNEWRLGPRSSLAGLFPGFGPLNAAIPSFPAGFPVLALDRVLASPPSLISSLSIHDSPLARIASDHLPLKARIRLGATKDRSSPPRVLIPAA